MIDAHVAYKKLVLKGMSEDLAEVITELMDERQNDLAIKYDIKLLKNDIDNIKSIIDNLNDTMATKADLANIKSELKEDISKLKNSMDKIDIILNWAKAL